MEDTLQIRCRGDDGHRAVTLRMRESLFQEIEKIAVQANYSRNELMNVILEYGIKNIELLPKEESCFPL